MATKIDSKPTISPINIKPEYISPPQDGTRVEKVVLPTTGFSTGASIVSPQFSDATKNPTTSTKGDPALQKDLAAQRAAANTGVVSTKDKYERPLDYNKKAPTLDEISKGAPIHMGMSGPSVIWLQQQMNAAGAKPPLVVDGKMGPKTTAALENYQKSRGVQDGNVDVDTRSGGCQQVPQMGANTISAFEKDNLLSPTETKKLAEQAIAEKRVNAKTAEEALAQDWSPYQGQNQNGVIPMSQGDFKGQLGNGQQSIRNAGCMLTSFAMASTAITGRTDLNPASANEAVKRGGGFAGSNLDTNNAANALGMRVVDREVYSNKQRSQLDNQLNAGKPVVLGVDYKAGSGGSGFGTGVDHWITVTGRNADGSYNCVDPAGGKSFTMHVDSRGKLVGNSPVMGHHYKAREIILLDKAG